MRKRIHTIGDIQDEALTAHPMRGEDGVWRQDHIEEQVENPEQVLVRLENDRDPNSEERQEMRAGLLARRLYVAGEVEQDRRLIAMWKTRGEDDFLKIQLLSLERHMSRLEEIDSELRELGECKTGTPVAYSGKPLTALSASLAKPRVLN